MSVVVLYNPVAGAGKSLQRAETVVQAIHHAGLLAELLATQRDATTSWLDDHLEGASALVVVGGDGAIRLAAPSASRTQTPIYHFPGGTENLFAREFGMNDDPRRLITALRDGKITSVDLAKANGEVFVLMASIGYDAEVVHDLAGRRGASISRWSYVGPMIRQFVRWRPPEVRLEIDGESVVAGTGFVIVANCRQYGWRLDPARSADMTDGKLDILYFSTASRFGLPRWLIKCRRGLAMDDPRVVFRRASTVIIDIAPPGRFQLDGDPPAADEPGEGTGRLEITLVPGALPVLTPERTDPAL